MADKTGISWTDRTFNGWLGCSAVSPGCENCYAEDESTNIMGLSNWGPTGFRVLTVYSYWKKALKWNQEPRKPGERLRVFCGSMCDVFEKWDKPIVDRLKKPYSVCAGGCPYPIDDQGIPIHQHFDKCPACGGRTREMTMDDVRLRLFELIRLTANLDWQMLTKRIDRVKDYLPDDWGPDGWPNVWIGTSAENQEWADKRLPVLREIPAVVRFVSYEPALGPIDFDKKVKGAPLHAKLDWAIYGGESGPQFRPHDLSWPRQARQQCEAAGVAFFYKQAANLKPGKGVELDGEVLKNFPTPRVPQPTVA